jgi:hypothetical protein
MSEHFGDRPRFPPWRGKFTPGDVPEETGRHMFPSDPASCLSRIRELIPRAEYELALARIEQLVAAERAIARQEQDEAHARRAGALLHKPVSAEEANKL